MEMFSQAFKAIVQQWLVLGHCAFLVYNPGERVRTSETSPNHQDLGTKPQNYPPLKKLFEKYYEKIILNTRSVNVYTYNRLMA